MLALDEILDERSVELNLRSRRRKDVLEELVGVLGRSMPIADPRKVADRLLERERMASTGIGRGVAVPHRLLPGFPRTAMAFGRCREGIAFEAIDRQPVSLFFLLLGPEGSQHEHLRLLSRLSRFLHEDAFLQALHRAESRAELAAAIRLQESRREVG